MQEKEYHTVDKTGWPTGVWQTEPDKIQFTDSETGYPCLIVRNHSGALCGYVGVTEGHPCFMQSHDDYWQLDVHGGLTFSGACSPKGGESHGICHQPDEGEPHNVWWLGFDCAHGGDLRPEYEIFLTLSRLSYGDNAVYRDVPYVKGQIAELARQLKTMEPAKL